MHLSPAKNRKSWPLRRQRRVGVLSFRKVDSEEGHARDGASKITGKTHERRRPRGVLLWSGPPARRPVDELFPLCRRNRRQYSSFNLEFTSFLCSHEEELTCSVCRSLMLLPTATTCSHVFCLECIENSLVVSNRCPLCRAPVAGEDTYGIHSLRPIEKLV